MGEAATDRRGGGRGLGLAQPAAPHPDQSSIVTRKRPATYARIGTPRRPQVTMRFQAGRRGRSALRMDGPLVALERRARRRALRRRIRAQRRLVVGMLVAALLAAAGASIGLASGPRAVVATDSGALGRSARPSLRAEPTIRRRSAPCPAPANVRPLLRRAASSSGLSPALLVSLASVESHFDIHAVSSAGAKGLFQLMPETAASLGIDPNDAVANAVAGARYLRDLLERFRALDLALSAYNAGPNAVSRAGGAPSIGVLRYALTIKADAGRLVGCTLAARPPL